jgi:Arylsulfotransferase (ASST)
VGAVLLGLLGFAVAPTPPDHTPAPYQHFRSRPDLKPPVVRIIRPAGRTAPGYLFVAPKLNALQAGPMILDNRGRLVWFRPLNTRGVTNFRVQGYRGRPVLTWWRQRPTGTGVDPWYTIANASYHTVAVVRPGGEVLGDIHEFLLTQRGTALMTTIRTVTRAGRQVTDGGIQELDLRTHRVVLDWHSVDHVPLLDSYSHPPRKRSFPFDYFHVNSIAVDTDGNLLVSARNTWTIYKLDRRTGRIIWRLGGKHSDFSFGRGARFAWQHDARRYADGTIRIFDNGAAPKIHAQSRVIFLHVNRRRRRARLVRAIAHKPPIVAINQGNVQTLPHRHLLVGWGHDPHVTEYNALGRVVLDLRFVGRVDSYRAFRFPWVGRPAGRPVATLYRGRVFTSWNGATEVRYWQLLAGPNPRSLVAVATVRKRGFETAIPAPYASWLAVRAIGGHGRPLGTTWPLQRR